jgi:hypothetical protein
MRSPQNEIDYIAYSVIVPFCRSHYLLLKQLLLFGFFLSISSKAIMIFFSSTFYMNTYHSRFIPEGVAEASQVFFQDAQALPKLFSYK